MFVGFEGRVGADLLDEGSVVFFRFCRGDFDFVRLVVFCCSLYF